MKVNVLSWVLFISLLFHSPVHSQERALQPQVKQFLSELLSKKEAQLIRYDEDGVFSDGGTLHADIYQYLYSPRRTDKSVVEIAKIDKLLFKIIRQPNNSIIVLFVPRKYGAQLRNRAFLESQWMRKFFACQFIVLQGQLKMDHNFCFAETDGPFPDSY